MTEKRKRFLLIVGVVGAVLIAGGALGIWWFLDDDAPEEVSLETAAQGLGQTTTGSDEVAAEDPSTTVAEPDESTTTPADGTDLSGAGDGIQGVWVVDTSLSEFDFEESTGSFVGFRVEEELTAVGSSTAVGRTPEVSGSVTIEGTTLTAVEVDADMSALVTNDSRRDSRARGALETDTFPTASFRLTEPVELGDNPTEGVTETAIGELTIHGITKPLEIPITAQLIDGVVLVTGSAEIEFGDFDVEVPSAPVVVSAEDHGPIEIQLQLSKQ